MYDDLNELKSFSSLTPLNRNRNPPSMAAKVVGRIFQPRLFFNVKHNNALLSTTRSNAFLYQRTYTTDQKSILSSPIPEFDGRPGINSYHDMYKFSLEHPDVFWGTLARSRLEWIKDFDKVQDSNFEEGKISWFLNGKINVSGEK